MKCFRVRLRTGLLLPAFAATALACVVALAPDTRAGTPPAYSIDFYAVSSGAKPSRNSCYVLSGTVGQPAPGYSSGGNYAVIAGFGAALPTIGLDEIFFDGFEACGP